MKQLSKEEQNLIVMQGVSTFAASLAGIFVTLFFFQYSDVKTTLLYYAIVLSMLLFWNVLSGYTLRIVSSGTLVKIGLISSALYYFLLFLLQEKAITFFIPLALLHGFSAGNYWAGYNLNQYIYTPRGSRVKYFSSVMILMNMFQAIGPAIGGLIVTLGGSVTFFHVKLGYSLLFLIVSLLLGFSSFLIGRLPSHEAPVFSFSHLFSHKRSKAWKYVLMQQATLGFYDVLLGTVSGVLMYLILKKELFLGFTQTSAFLLGAIGGYIASKTLERSRRTYWIGVLGLTVGIGLFAFFQNVFGILAYTVITGISAPFLHIWLSSVYYKAIDSHDRHWSEKYHLMIERESALGIPRVISYLLLYGIVQYGDQIQFAKYSLFVLMFFPLLIGLFLRFYAHTTVPKAIDPVTL